MILNFITSVTGRCGIGGYGKYEKEFEDVYLDIVTVLLWVQEMFPILMK